GRVASCTGVQGVQPTRARGCLLRPPGGRALRSCPPAAPDTRGRPSKELIPMSSTAETLQQKAKDHLWMHFSRQQMLADGTAPIIVKGDGHHIWDAHGKRYFDGLSGLFTVNAGHG